jgi:class 3 adenylate cyclase
MRHPNRHRRWYEDLESFSRRVLTTVLFTDVVDSTGRVCELGDRSWTDVLRTHHARFRDRLSLFGGREVDAAGDGFLEAFDVPTHAVAFACAFHEGVVDLRLEVRTGVHTGECELEDGRLRGVAVHVGARLASLARPGEVLVSSTVRDVVAGSGLRFVDRGRAARRPGAAQAVRRSLGRERSLHRGAPGRAADGGGCHAPQAPGTAREHGRRGMMGSRVRDRPGPRAYPSRAPRNSSV